VKLALALSDSALATIVLSFAVGAILTMPLTGALVTRLGGARTVLATGVASALALALLGASTTYAGLLAATLFTGIAVGGLDVSMNTQATVIEQTWRGPIMSGIHGWFSLGALSGAALGGGMIQADMSFRAALSLTAGLALAAIVAAWPWLAVANEPRGGAGFAWPKRAMLGIGVLCLLALLFEGAVFDWTAVYMHDVAGAPLGFASAAFAGFSLTMAAMRLAGDSVVRRFGPVRVLTGGAALSASGIALACAIPHPAAVTVGLTLTGVGQANIVPLLFSAAGRVPGVAPGAGIAMAATMGYGAFLLGPPMIGFVADAVGLRTALLILVAAALGIAAGGRVVRG
jgi:MFS family permease